MIKHIGIVLAATSLLAGCQSGQLTTVKEIGNAPSMSPIGSGLAYGQTQQMSLYPKQPHHMASGFSLWSDSQAALFKDARALAVGDIMTVNISINDKASFDNETDRSRKNSKDTSWNASAKIFGWKPETDSTLGFDSDSESKGKGTISRSEKLTLLVAAVVTGVLENGNLVISGSQEVRVNHEIRILNVAGIVRPQDVSSENTISYDKIAEARISYGGRGRLMEVQQPPVGQQISDIFSPI
jgi:flagellar L-ring protein precursor FlgH